MLSTGWEVGGGGGGGGANMLGSLLLHRVTESSDKGSRGVPYLGLVGAFDLLLSMPLAGPF